MKNISLKRTAVVLLLSTTTALCTSCSFLSQLFESKEEMNERLHEAPLFWDYATYVEGSSNLLTLNNKEFDGKPYNTIEKFEDNLLLVGNGTYNNSDVYEYSFDVYSPWANELTASLSHDEINCDSYQIVGDKLFLYNCNTEANRIQIYDKELKFQTEITYQSNNEIPLPLFYPTGNNDKYLSVFYDGPISEITIKDGQYTETPLSLNYTNFSYIGISKEDNTLAFSALNKDNLKKEIVFLDATDYTIKSVVAGGAYDDPSYQYNTVASTASWFNHYFLLTDGTSERYFHQPDTQLVEALPENGFFTRGQFDDGTIFFSSYDANGTNYSTASYQSSDYISLNACYLEDCNCVFNLVYTEQCHPYLLIWDLSKETKDGTDLALYDSYDSIAFNEVEDLSEYYGENYGYHFTNIPDAANYDFGDLTTANEKATEIEETYGVSIFIGPEVPSQIDCFNLESFTNAEELESALDKLSTIFSYYPTDFFSQLVFDDNRNLLIYLCGTMSSNIDNMVSSPAGFVNTINNYNVMVLDVSNYYSWDYTVCHEMSHLIDKRTAFYQTCNPEDALFSEETWNSYNPSDFTYMESYSGYEDASGDYIYTYFIDSYGTTYPTEDRAEIMGSAMQSYIENDKSLSFEKDSPLYNKLAYYSSCIRQSFQTNGWPEKLSWEKYL